MTTAEELYPLVTEAIQRAETLEDLGAPNVCSAYLDVSKLEEKVAELLPASDPEGMLARRGAVRAAVAAKEFARARMLAERFLADAELDDTPWGWPTNGWAGSSRHLTTHRQPGLRSHEGICESPEREEDVHHFHRLLVEIFRRG